MRDAERLRFEDVMTFLAVHETRSVSAAARRLDVTPSQVSKAIARLEAYCGTTLLTRGARGVTVSLGGLEVLPRLQEVARGVRELRHGRAELRGELRLAAPSSLLPWVARVVASLAHVGRIALISADARARTLSLKDVIDIAIGFEPKPFGAPYTHELIGHVAFALLARPTLAERLGPPPVAPESLRGLPFAMPMAATTKGLVLEPDRCPLAFEGRTRGHAAETFEAALEIAARSDHLVFGPRLSATGHLARGELVAIAVRGWATEHALYLGCHATRVRARIARALREAIVRELPDVAS